MRTKPRVVLGLLSEQMGAASQKHVTPQKRNTQKKDMKSHSSMGCQFATKTNTKLTSKRYFRRTYRTKRKLTPYSQRKWLATKSCGFSFSSSTLADASALISWTLLSQILSMSFQVSSLMVWVCPRTRLKRKKISIDEHRTLCSKEVVTLLHLPPWDGVHQSLQTQHFQVKK